MSTLVYISPQCADINHGTALGPAINVNGIRWTPVLWYNEDDPTFVKTSALCEVRTKELDYDARRDPKTDRYCAKCQKDTRFRKWARTAEVIHIAQSKEKTDGE